MCERTVQMFEGREAERDSPVFLFFVCTSAVFNLYYVVSSAPRPFSGCAGAEIADSAPERDAPQATAPGSQSREAVLEKLREAESAAKEVCGNRSRRGPFASRSRTRNTDRGVPGRQKKPAPNPSIL